jgi:hypothetical protein
LPREADLATLLLDAWPGNVAYPCLYSCNLQTVLFLAVKLMNDGTNYMVFDRSIIMVHEVTQLQLRCPGQVGAVQVSHGVSLCSESELDGSFQPAIRRSHARLPTIGRARPSFVTSARAWVRARMVPDVASYERHFCLLLLVCGLDNAFQACFFLRRISRIFTVPLYVLSWLCLNKRWEQGCGPFRIPLYFEMLVLDSFVQYAFAFVA